MDLFSYRGFGRAFSPRCLDGDASRTAAAVALTVRRKVPARVDVLIEARRDSLAQRVLSELDSDSRRAYRRLHETLAFATWFMPAAIRRKGYFVATLYLLALANAKSFRVREAQWRRFIATTASLLPDLESCASQAPNDAARVAYRRAHSELVRIVNENVDLLEPRQCQTGRRPKREM